MALWSDTNAPGVRDPPPPREAGPWPPAGVGDLRPVRAAWRQDLWAHRDGLPSLPLVCELPVDRSGLSSTVKVPGCSSGRGQERRRVTWREKGAGRGQAGRGGEGSRPGGRVRRPLPPPVLTDTRSRGSWRPAPPCVSRACPSGAAPSPDAGLRLPVETQDPAWDRGWQMSVKRAVCLCRRGFSRQWDDLGREFPPGSPRDTPTGLGHSPPAV